MITRAWYPWHVDPQLFSPLLRDYLLPATPGPALGEIIRIAADQARSAQSLVAPILEGPGLKDSLYALKPLQERVAAWRAEENPDRPDLEEIVLTRVVNLLGKSATRNALLAAELRRVSIPAGARAAPSGGTTPQELLPYALQFEELCLEKQWPYPERAFLAGLHYDWLKALLAGQKASPDLRAYVEPCFKQGLHLARVAHELAARVGRLKHGGWAAGAGLLLPLGCELMAIAFPKSLGARSWASFAAESEKWGARREAWIRLNEPERFAATSDELAALYAGFFGAFTEVERAMRFHRVPDALRHVDPDQAALAAVLCVAVSAVGSVPPGGMGGGAKKIPQEFRAGPLERRMLSQLRIPESAVSGALKHASPS